VEPSKIKGMEHRKSGDVTVQLGGLGRGTERKGKKTIQEMGGDREGADRAG